MQVELATAITPANLGSAQLRIGLGTCLAQPKWRYLIVT